MSASGASTRRRRCLVREAIAGDSGVGSHFAPVSRLKYALQA